MKIYLQSYDLFDPDKQRWLKKHAPNHYQVQQEINEVYADPLIKAYSRFFVDLPDNIATLYMLRWA